MVRGPTWDIAQLFPQQGQWDETEYLALPVNHLVELSNGYLEFPPMPSPMHQWIVLFLYKLLDAFAWPKQGMTLVAPLPVRLWPGKIREPDIAFLLNKNRRRFGKKLWKGADLVMEVVSPGKESRERDLVTKPKEYAKAGISEYWIVDPKLGRITVLSLKGKKYETAGVFQKGDQAVSPLLPGFSVAVDDVFAEISGM